MSFMEIQGLSKHFGGLVAVDKLDFNLEPGDTVGLIGPNGSGKTTTLNLLTGFVKPTYGKIMFNGHDITNLPRCKVCGHGVARTFQLIKPFLEFTALENVMVGRLFGQEPSRNMKEAAEESREYLGLVGLLDKAAAVLTTMPIIPDKPIDFGLQDFCEHCGICADVCPSNAIPKGDKVIYNGYETWKLDTKRCGTFNFTNKKGTMCNRCVKACPWSQSDTWPHNLVRRLVIKSRLARRIAIWGAKFLKLEADHPDEKWWFNIFYTEDGLVKAIGEREAFRKRIH